mmetsp:Transcript_12308/g.11137  ORF Transcript_12308/g.11137 Transcript_12308/m.11137 type:complete len:505 (-) Transcript_12308:145-1659(-)|eukprot:CAMPEP_0196763688 /NCGR_PEP_ID=MMETSP1095-20130614/4522_1 /TAXON_ID=96789 ORGANISM="Chromulina nebulosa, Strain UTEXLB2642" /NCGR_SAMPLE_ID=MMETSP1095 /ASSEMBLY_ACC=CAM_ASM_000446 /LENGTH=504 /DNA_ID=CAMNT_0042117375 /DNA_START=82 /DNA_END=1596 /DNA_ORIENTATION=+
MSRLLNVSILHRHGSRGPGKSELSPWDECSPVRSQWDPEDIENITPIGHEMMKSLGKWFYNYLTIDLLSESDKITPDEVLWRCSKSTRAKESGLDFVSSMNDCSGLELFGNDPHPYDENPDVYFRPWKIYTEETKKTKSTITRSDIFNKKVEEFEDFLIRVAETAKVVDDYKFNLGKCLWSTTHFYNMLDCEKFWVPYLKDDGSLSKRHSLQDLIVDENMRNQIKDLACWVLGQRFISSNYKVEMGGIMCSEVLQAALTGNYKLCIYSGHDYTILALLSVMGLISKLDVPLGFGCYIIFEVWERAPPPSEMMSSPNLKKRVSIDPISVLEDHDMSVYLHDNEIHSLMGFKSTSESTVSTTSDSGSDFSGDCNVETNNNKYKPTTVFNKLTEEALKRSNTATLKRPSKIIADNDQVIEPLTPPSTPPSSVTPPITSESDNRYVRIILNPSPFKPPVNGAQAIDVDVTNSKILAELHVSEIEEMLTNIHEYFNKRGITVKGYDITP